MAHSFIYTNYDEALSQAKTLATHPLDLVFVTNETFDPGKKENKSLTVDATREMIKSAYISPLGENKVFIVPHAELMTLNSQNALLKLIEEPPPGVYFFFITNTPKTLLPTILSRSQIVYGSECPELDTDIYNTLLPLCKKAAGDRWQVADRYKLEFALVNLKDNKVQCLDALENIFSFTNPEIGDNNILKANMQKKIAIARQQIKQNCNWQSIIWQLIVNSE